MASATTSDFVATATRPDAPPFALIEPKSLPARLAEEVARALSEFRRDPGGFLHNLFTDDTRDAKRRRRIYFGLAGALVVHALLLTVIVVIGWRSLAAPKESGYEVQRIDLPSQVAEGETKAKAAHDDSGQSGGGREEAPPVTKGPPPPTSPAPQIIKPFTPPVEHASLPVMATIKGPESPPPAVDLPVGLPNGATDAPPSPGEGKRDGIGGREGTGAGPNGGPGGGRPTGNSTNPNGSSNGTPNGTGVPSDIPFNGPKPSGYVPFALTYAPTPIVTPEAQEHKVIGRVLLRATFNANGTITDIEVINPVDYMTDSAIESLRRSKFRPATINGVPITVRRVPVRIDVHY
ncbi:MAG TPA: energy transducer TonB [Blastocatellia bacterium]|nr:energy transducer TonB [Blastocatellia bacterium]